MAIFAFKQVWQKQVLPVSATLKIDVIRFKHLHTKQCKTINSLVLTLICSRSFCATTLQLLLKCYNLVQVSYVDVLVL